jgi:hypothetical protein
MPWTAGQEASDSGPEVRSRNGKKDIGSIFYMEKLSK